MRTSTTGTNRVTVDAWVGRDGWPMLTITNGSRKLYVSLDVADELAEMISAETDRFRHVRRT